MNWWILMGLVVVGCIANSATAVLYRRQQNAMVVRVAELENRMTAEDENRRQIQRLALERLQERKANGCQKKSGRSL